METFILSIVTYLLLQVTKELKFSKVINSSESSEAFASELLEYPEEIILNWYFIDSDIICHTLVRKGP